MRKNRGSSPKASSSRPFSGIRLAQELTRYQAGSHQRRLSMPTALLHHCLRLVLGLLFIGSSLIKLTDLPGFARQLGDFGIVADALVPASAWLVCLLELFAGFGLLTNVRGSLAVVASILILFCSVLVRYINNGMILGLDIDCGCFGPGYRVSLKTQFTIDLGLLLFCALVHWSRKKCGVKTIGLFALLAKARGQRATLA